MNQPAERIHNLIRGLSPYPAAFTLLQGKMLKIYQSEKELKTPTQAPGEVISDGRTSLKFACRDGYISVQELQMEGKRRMNVADFLRGFRI